MEYRVPRSDNSGKWRRMSSATRSLKGQKLKLNNKGLRSNDVSMARKKYPWSQFVDALKIHPRALPPRIISQDLMTSIGLKQILVYWHLNPQYDASDILAKLFLVDHSTVADIKKWVLWSKETDIKDAAKASNAEKGEKTLAQYYSTLVKKCEPLITNRIPDDPKEKEELLMAFWKALAITFEQVFSADDPRSDHVQKIIIPRIRDYLLTVSPQLDKIIEPPDFIRGLTAKELVMAARILRIIGVAKYTDPMDKDKIIDGFNIRIKKVTINTPTQVKLYAIARNCVAKYIDPKMKDKMTADPNNMIKNVIENIQAQNDLSAIVWNSIAKYIDPKYKDKIIADLDIKIKNVVDNNHAQTNMYAIVRNGDVWINKAELSNITAFESAEAKKRIIIEQGGSA